MSESATGESSGALSFTTSATNHERVVVGVLAGLWVAGAAGLGLRELPNGGRTIVVIVGLLVALVAVRLLGLRLRGTIGIDGVKLDSRGSATFRSFRELDEVKRAGHSIAILRRGEVVVRFSFSDDASRVADAVFTRLRDGVARANDGTRAALVQLVVASTPEMLVRMARGESDYRAPMASREDLWSLLEGPELAARARCAVASAIAASEDDAGRARLRVVASACAEPSVRIALEQMARAEPDAGQGMRRAAT